MTARNYLVRGRVQGVGFRNFVQRRAAELDLCGWVRNLPDGTVEVQAEGAPAALEALEQALKDGPRFSRVDEVLSQETAPEGAGGFTIKGR